MSLLYYQEKADSEGPGDYLVIDPQSAAYFEQIGQPGICEGRAVAIRGQLASVHTTGISRAYLQECCLPIPKQRVPHAWLQRLGE
jgi:hypothetical protein